MIMATLLCLLTGIPFRLILLKPKDIYLPVKDFFKYFYKLFHGLMRSPEQIDFDIDASNLERNLHLSKWFFDNLNHIQIR